MRKMLILILLSIFAISLLTPTLAQEKEKVYRFRYIQPVPKPPVHFNVFVRGSWYGYSGMILEPLAWYHMGNYSWIPWLATSWELSEDGLLLTVHLRKGVKWADGKPFTSKDVVTTWYCGYLVNWWYWNYIEKVEAVDDYTVKFYLKEPWIFAEYYILRGSIVPYSIYGEYADKAIEYIKAGKTEELSALKEEFNKFRPEKLIGTGPFEFVTVTEQGGLLRKRKEWWNGIDRVKYDEYYQLNIGGPAEFSAILARAMDMVSPDLTRAIYEQIKAREDLKVIVDNWRHGQALVFNWHRYPLSLVEVRKAIAYAINRTELCVAVSPVPDVEAEGKIVGPFEWPVGLNIGEEYKWIGKEYLEKYFDKYEFNPKKTEEIFKKLGFEKGADGIWVTPNGTRLSFELISAPWTDWALSVENIKIQLARVGIEIKPYSMEPIICTRVPAGDFDMAVYCLWSQFMPVPEGYQRWAIWGYGEGIGSKNAIFKVPGELVGKPEVEWVEVNATEWCYRLTSTLDVEEQKKIIRALAYITNQYLPGLPLRAKPSTYVINVLENEWPPEDDPFWKWAYTDEPYVLYMLLGIIRPKVVTVPRIEYVGVWMTADVKAFTGADGRVYGPYKNGTFAILPREDAETLVLKGLASYTAPAPPPVPVIPEEVKEIIRTTASDVAALKSRVETLEGMVKGVSEAVAGVKADVGDTSSSVAKLGERIKTLEDTVGGLSSMLYASIGLNVIVLIAVIVAIVMARRR